LNFLNPLAFALLGLAPVIILLYLLKLKRRPKVVSSTLFWFRAVQDLEANAPFQRLRKNLLLLLQLIILLLLILVLTRPYLRAATKVKQSIAIILDCSASMQATDESPSRFDAARGKAETLIRDLSEGDRAMLIAAAHKAQVLQSLTHNKEELLKGLQRATAWDTETDLAEAFLLAQSLLAKAPGSEIVILSDGGFESLPPLASENVQVRFVPLGQTCDNLAITALDIRPDPSTSGAYQLFTSVSNFAAEARSADLELYVDDRIADSQPIEIPSGGQSAQVFRVSGVERGILQVRLDVSDDLETDNRAFAVFAPEETTDVLLAGEGNYFLQRMLALDPRVRLSIASAEEYASVGDYDLTVFNGWCPPSLNPNGNFVFLACAPASWEATVSAPAVDYPPVVDWSRSHALLRFVSLENVLIGRTLRLQSPASAEVLIESVETPLMTVSIEQGRFFSLFIPFDLNDTNWMLRASFPIFVTNLIDFSRDAPGGRAFAQQRTGRPAPIFVGSSPADRLDVRTPGGQTYTLPVNGDPVYFASTEQAGLYQVTGPERPPQWFAVNLLSAKESNVSPRAEIQMGGESLQASSGEMRSNREIWRSLAIAALLVFLVEWWVYHRRIGV